MRLGKRKWSEAQCLAWRGLHAVQISNRAFFSPFSRSFCRVRTDNFELLNNVVNLSKCKLCFDINLQSNATTSRFHKLNGNALSLIDRITLTSRSGNILADIPNCHIFGNLVSATNTKLSDLMIRTPPTTTTLPSGAASGGSVGKNLTSTTSYSSSSIGRISCR
jgi:hypothetical protein